jgi:hypothetical protein
VKRLANRADFDHGIKTARGGQWQSLQVMRLLDRLGL